MNKKAAKSQIKTAILCGLITVLGFSAGSVFAQYYDSPGLGQQPVATHPQDYKPLGVRAGAFMLHPGVQLGAQWTDNAFYSNSNEQDDTVYHVRPYITAQSTWSRHALNIRLAADFARYDKYSEREYEDYFLNIDGRIDVKTRSSFSYGLDYLDLHEGLNNRTSEQGVKPTRYKVYGGRLGYDQTFNRLSLGVFYRLYHMDFDDVLGANDRLIDNQDRDRDAESYGARAGYQFKTDKQVFVQYTHYSVEYDEPVDRNGYRRDGDGYSLAGGLSLSITAKLNGDIYAVYHDHEYDDPRLPNTKGWGGGAGLQWNPTDMTSVYGSVATSVEETTYSNSSGFLQTVYSLRADHELTRFLQISGFVAYRRADYQSIDPTLPNTRDKDNIWRTGLGLNWYINRHMYLHGSYGHEVLDSSLPNDDYTTNNVWLLLGLEY